MPRNLKALSLCLLLSLVWVGCQNSGPKFNPRAPGGAVGAGSVAGPSFTPVVLSNQIPSEWLKPPRDFYRLGPGDSLDVEMIGEPLSRSGVTVGPDGKIYYGLLPGTFVWGLTLSETKDTLEQGLAKYLRVKPEVTLSLGTNFSKRVWVLGQVRKPGVYVLAAPMTLLELISAAGGTVTVPGVSDEVADLENSYVMRAGQALPVNMYKLLRQGDMSQNIYVMPDDFIYLRPASTREVSVLGAVVKPALLDYSEQMTLLTAVANAGGTIPYAYVSHVVIVRGALSQPRVATVDLAKIRKGASTDVPLAAGDIVYVPFRPTQKIEQLVNLLVSEFVRTVAVNEGVRAVSSTAAPVVPTVSFGTSR